MQCIELFIETEPIDRHVAVDDPESYIPCITQGFNALGINSVGFNEDASTSAFAWHGATDQNRYTSDHDTGDCDQYVAPTVEENVTWPFSSARHWSSLDVDDDPLDISRNAHIGSSVGAIPSVVGLDRSIPPIDHEDHRLPELSSDIHRDDTDISTEPDLSLSDTDEDDGRDGNDRFEYIGPSSPVQPSLYDVPEFFSTIYDEQCPDSIGVPSVSSLSYYNADRGEISTNMVFKDKKHLISAIKDFSVRVARREYEVVESMKTLWKAPNVF
ncbi:hypothetical protein F511_38090 [Dorcoceras hygrometricum]|uniref:Uncharacterized protein n=1 Tax=Dorcoceras hygrometricum TaxID=472368 RepID=A0A2Z7C3M9_9LAMI|nr:hypothetical protein F511_38090 [Dorcoceras hygrometricum]